MTLAQVRDYAAVDRWSPDNENGYQRPAVIRRYREVAKYVAEEQGILPNICSPSYKAGRSPANRVRPRQLIRRDGRMGPHHDS